MLETKAKGRRPDYAAMMRPKSLNQDMHLIRLYSKEQMTKAVYRRIGEKVRPTK